ncbi:MAG: hypothetical protein HMLIMOIP_002279 [Candidatus Nitrosomirales archaeon]|jgi:hypothetical protein
MPEVVQREEILDGDLKEKTGPLLATIDSLIDQTLQIFELTSKESDIIESIGSSISILLTTLKLSLTLSQPIFQNDFPAIKSAVLNSNAEIIIMQANGNIITKKFSELDSGQVVSVIKEIVPKLSQSAEARKNEVTEKITMLRKVAKQFQRVNTLPTDGKKQEDDE